MNIFNTPEFKVGILVVVVSGLVAMMSIKVSEDPSYLGSSKRIWFIVEDASGLIKKSPVRVAGIRVGIIENIFLQNGLARIDMIIKSEVRLTKSTKVEIRPNGILGDKHIEVIPGNPNDPLLAHNDQILSVEDNASIDRLVNEVSKITGSLSQLVNNITDATEGDDSKPMGKIVKNLEIITTDLAALMRDKKGEIDGIVTNLHSLTESLNKMVSDESETGLQATWERNLNRIDSIVGNIDEVTTKINEGEGTIGRLINDETTVEQINTAVAGVNEFLDSGSRIKTSIDYYSQYLNTLDGVRSYVGIVFEPGLDRFYEFAVVSSPEDPTSTTDREILDPNGNVTSTTTERIRYRNNVKYTALFGKRFYDFIVKGGVMESGGGVGFEYRMFNDDLKLQVDAFNFEDAQARAYLRYDLFKGLYVMTGHHQYFKTGTSGEERSSTFVGAGLLLRNEDLKSFMSLLRFN